MQSVRGINLEHMDPSDNPSAPQNHTEMEENSRLRHQLETSQANERTALARYVKLSRQHRFLIYLPSNSAFLVIQHPILAII